MHEPDAAVALVHARAADSLLLMRRSERDDDPWSGHWSFPGGRRDPRDRDLLETALRELSEECGIQLARAQLEAALPAAVARRRVGRYLQVAPFVLRVDTELPALPDLVEAVEALWVPLSLLRDPARHSLHNVPGVPPEILFPAIDLNGVPLWGFTYRLITELLGLLPSDQANASFQAAGRLLNALLTAGVTLDQGWTDEEGPKVATVRGAIPAEMMLATAAMPTGHIPPINRLEVHADRIRVVGLQFEEYIIRAVC